MSPMQYRYRRDYDRVVKYTEQLHALMESGTYWRLGFRERYKLVRRINRLYRRLTGVFRLSHTRTILLAAGVFALTGCPEAGTGDANTPPEASIEIGDQEVTEYTVANGESVTFEVNASDADGDSLSYQWSVDDSAVDGETNETFTTSFTPSAQETFNITVDVFDGTDTTTATVVLTVLKPGLAVTISGDSNVVHDVVDYGVATTFTATVINDEGGALSYAWKLDGSDLPGETGSSVELTFGTDIPNDHDVEVTVSETGGDTASQTYSIVVRIDPEFYTADEFGDGIDSAYQGSGYDTNYNVGSSYALSGMLLGDLDGDGDMDAIVTAQDTSAPQQTYQNWLSGDGSYPPIFTSEGAIPGDLSGDLYSNFSGDGYFVRRYRKLLDLVDFDNDGDADLVVGTFHYYYTESPSLIQETTLGLTLFENEPSGGAPNFTMVGDEFGAYGLPYLTYSGPQLPYYDYIASGRLADMDNDGDLDLVYAYTYPGEDRVLAVAENTAGAGNVPQFTDNTDVANGTSSLGTDVYRFVGVGDLDMDGDNDILVGTRYYVESGYNSFRFFENSGTPGEFEFVTIPGENPFNMEYAFRYDYYVRPPLEIEIVDVDDDGDVDVITGWSWKGSERNLAPQYMENFVTGDPWTGGMLD